MPRCDHQPFVLCHSNSYLASTPSAAPKLSCGCCIETNGVYVCRGVCCLWFALLGVHVVVHVVVQTRLIVFVVITWASNNLAGW